MKIESHKEHNKLLVLLDIAAFGGKVYGREAKKRVIRWLASEIEAYEQKHWPIPKATRAEAKAFRREQERK